MNNKWTIRPGDRFGRLVVEGQGEGITWHCRCDCGAQTTPSKYDLVYGKSRSCGCTRTTHGRRNTTEYAVWRAIVYRCTNPNGQQWPDYGGRGIKICPKWREDFAAFLEHIGPRPSLSHSADRIDNSRGYEPGNVRWATAKEQARNRRGNRLIDWDGVSLPASEWAERKGMSTTLLHYRLKNGWSIERALSTPVRFKSPNKEKAQ